MLQLASHDPRRFPLRMPVDINKARENELAGRALRVLRERRRLSQGLVGRSLGMTSQAWQKYEAGERHLPDDKIDEVIGKLPGASRSEFEDARRQIETTSGGVAERPQAPFLGPPPAMRVTVWGRAAVERDGPLVRDATSPQRIIDLAQTLGAEPDAMEIAGESMSPWGEAGDVVLFNRERWPKRGRPSVIELKSGELHVLMYGKTDGSTLFAEEIHPQTRTRQFPMSEVKGVYAVIGKIE